MPDQKSAIAADSKSAKKCSLQDATGLSTWSANLMSWPENQGILFFVYFSNISNEPDIFHGFTS